MAYSLPPKDISGKFDISIFLISSIWLCYNSSIRLVDLFICSFFTLPNTHDGSAGGLVDGVRASFTLVVESHRVDHGWHEIVNKVKLVDILKT